MELVEACRQGDMNAAEDCLRRCCFKNLHLGQDKPFRAACSNGHEHIARMLWATGKNKSNPIRIAGSRAFEKACKHGHADIAKWLFLVDATVLATVPTALALACRGQGKLSLVKWLFAIGGDSVQSVLPIAFLWACERGHIGLAAWLLDAQSTPCAAAHHAFVAACTQGHLTLAKSLAQRVDVRVHAMGMVPELFRLERVQVLDWLWTFAGLQPYLRRIIPDEFLLACARGSVPVARWCHVRAPVDLLCGLENACRWGHVWVVKWFFHCVRVDPLLLLQCVKEWRHLELGRWCACTVAADSELLKSLQVCSMARNVWIQAVVQARMF
jgi:hypothetical protein